MNLFDAATMIRTLMNQHGLYNWQFEWSRSRRIFGTCYSHSRRITVSPHLTELNSEYEVRDTILHEIAHALVGPGHRHDVIWKVKAKEIGARPERCYSSNKVVEPPRKWHGTCVSCGVIIKRHRVSRNMRATGFHPRCRKNGTGGEIQWRENVVIA